MKKLTFFAVVALLAVIALPAMATDFTWSGEVTLGYISNGNAATGTTTLLSNNYLNVVGKLDDNVSFYGELLIEPDTKGFPVTGGYLYGTADLGKALGLPIGEVLTFGYVDTTTQYYNASAWGNEEVGDLDPGLRYNLSSVTTIGPANILLSVDPSQPGANPSILANAYGTFGPVKASIAYYTNKVGTGGLALADVNFSQKMGDLGFAVDGQAGYDLTAQALKWGAGANVTYTTLLTVGLGTSGTTSSIGNIDINVNLVPMTSLGVDLAASFATTGFNGIDSSVWYKIDKSTLRVGYAYTTNGTGLYWPAAETNGGIYFSYDLTF
jgi:hypothetical protein